MAKFNLKEHIAKNKATFFGSLTEGQFSWMTQDTGQQIGSQDENMIPVYMFDDKGKYYYENDYEGYGVFGGMDYYELLDQMNGGEGDRGRGIDLAFGKEKTGSEILFPALVTKPDKFNYRTHNFAVEAETDPNQSWYEPEEDDFYDQNDEEEYGDNEDDMMEGLNEAKMYYHVLEDGGYGRIGHQGYYNTPEEAKKRADTLSDMFPKSEFYVEAYPSKKEPVTVTMEGKKKYYKDAEADDAEHIKALEKDMKDDKKSSLKEGTAASFSEWLEGIKNINSKVANDFQKHPKLANAKSKEEFIKIAKEVGELYGEDEDQIIHNVGNTIYVKEFPSTGYKSISVSSGLESYGRYVDETENRIDNETSDQLSNRIYPKGSRMDENKPTTKMKKSELKEKIKEMVLDEMNIDIDNTTKEYDFLAELEGMLNEVYPFAKNKPGRIAEFITALNRLVDEYHAELYLNKDWGDAIEMVIQAAKEEATNLVNEAEDDNEKDTAETDTETTTDIETTDVTTTTVDPNVKAVQDALTQAQVAAQKLGDPKLTDQIGNTITFFTREHVVEKPKSAVAEEMNLNITEDITADIEKKIKSGEIDPKEVEAAAKKAMSGDSTDLALMMAGFGKMFETKKEDKKEKDVAEDLNEAMFPLLKKILK